MNRLLTAVFIILAALAASAPAAPIPDAAKAPGLYFPTKVGAKWVYQHGDEEITEVVKEVRRAGDTTVVTVVLASGADRGCQPQQVEVSAAGLRRLEDYGLALSPPMWLLKLTTPEGNKWSTAFERGGQAWAGVRWVAGKEAVRVPAGTFTAIRVEWEFEVSNRPQRSTNWFAPGVGMVKGGREGSYRVLKSFTPGRD